MRYVLSIPDPVHNYIRLNKLEKTLIGLPKFQRLKRIKQLGVASVVFPGALHTRFEHSLGTMHVADMIFDRFSDDFEEIDRYKVRLAGLLHDIGHSAFSHTIEQGLRRIEKIVEPRYKRHESYTRNIISNLAKANIVKKALKEAEKEAKAAAQAFEKAIREKTDTSDQGVKIIEGSYKFMWIAVALVVLSALWINLLNTARWVPYVMVLVAWVLTFMVGTIRFTFFGQEFKFQAWIPMVGGIFIAAIASFLGVGGGFLLTPLLIMIGICALAAFWTNS